MSQLKELREKRASIHSQVVESLKQPQSVEMRSKVDAMRRWHEQRRKSGISWNPHGSKTKAEAAAPALG
jgi:hypothetical protein